jgi:hypothetical protein
MSSFLGPTMFGKRARSAATIAAGVVHRQRGLGDVGELVGVGDLQAGTSAAFSTR